jgi:hypothetical protein
VTVYRNHADGLCREIDHTTMRIAIRARRHNDTLALRPLLAAVANYDAMIRESYAEHEATPICWCDSDATTPCGSNPSIARVTNRREHVTCKACEAALVARLIASRRHLHQTQEQVEARWGCE